MNLIDSGYTISQQSVARMNEAGIPSDVISLLDGIQGETFGSRKAFSEEGYCSNRGNTISGSTRMQFLKVLIRSFLFLNSFSALMLEPISMFYLALAIGGLQIIFGCL
jgi:hypothetical protein